MRLSIFFMLIAVMQVSGKSYGQYVTIDKKNITFRSLFNTIKQQTGYDVLWRANEFDANKKGDFKFINVPVDFVIRKLTDEIQLSFIMEDRSIIIKNFKKSLSTAVVQDSVIVRGKVTDENNRPLGGATVKVLGNNRSTFTDVKGEFRIYSPVKGTLEISYVGYLNTQITLNGLNRSEVITVGMVQGNNNLGEVNIVSTGYQDISKERATGSFEVITKEQLQHSSDPNLIRRLEGITTSMNFNNNLIPNNSASTVNAVTDPSKSPLANLTIRGKNTLNPNQVSFGNESGTVLVVIDGIPNPYPIDNINPNDVESITILKDAAAASIWGSKAANGVIVVKTKKGGYQKPLGISFNSNINITEKLDLFYKKVMSTSEYIDAQIFQFNIANTRVDPPTIGSPQSFLSPVATILGRRQNGQISSAQTNSEIDLLRGNDIRKDFSQYVQRASFTQSYSLGIDGGGKKITYRVSAAYDKNLQNSYEANDDRLALGYSTAFKPLKNIELTAGISYTKRTTHNQAFQDYISSSITSPFYPYTRLADDNGNALSIPYKYRQSFLDLLSTTYGSSIQSLTFTPLENRKLGYYNTKFNNINFNLGTNILINSAITANLVYNYNIGNNNQEYLYKQNSFYVRNLVTYYTSPSGNQSIPNGSIYSPITTHVNSQALRGQLNVNKDWGSSHSFNAIAGLEITQGSSLSKTFQYYGYNEETLYSNNQLNFRNPVPVLFDTGFGSSVMIPYTSSSFFDSKTRTYSLFSNASYTLEKRYTLSASVRKDMSSDFGVGTNKGGTPFFSIGGKWNIANEQFYSLNWLPILQFRATFGYNGNVNPVVSARQIIGYQNSMQENGLTSATTVSGSVSNKLLRPERTGIFNSGIDFGLRNRRLTGSIEYYSKKTTDLIASNAIDPSTGFNRLDYNTASLKGWGADVIINSQNIRLRKFSWGSTVLFSSNRVKVTELFTPAAKSAGDVVAGVPSYNVGADLSRLYAYRWAGLDPNNGSPRGYINGQPFVVNSSAAYVSVANLPMASAKYFGSSVPVYFGSLRNTFRYSSFSISANILYKLGYYFRRPQNDMVRYAQLFGAAGSNAVLGGEYSKRWQKSGDELVTDVPSRIYPANNLRDLFYTLSEINVLKADHVRLQEINLSYSLLKKSSFLKNPRIYANVSNLGILWRANKMRLDPDIADYPNPRSYAFGFSANF